MKKLFRLAVLVVAALAATYGLFVWLSVPAAYGQGGYIQSGNIPTGTGVAGQITYWSGTRTLTGSSFFTITGGLVQLGTTPCISGTYAFCLDTSAPATLSAELVTNGTFSSALTGWTVSGTGTGWTSSAGALHGAGNTETLTQAIAVTSGATYFVTVLASGASAGTLTMTLAGESGSYVLGNGTNYYSYTVTATTNRTLTFTPTSPYNGKITSVSVKQITAFIDPVMQGGSAGIDLRSPLLPNGVANSGFVNNGVGPNYDQVSANGAQSLFFGWRSGRQAVTAYQNSAFGTESQENLTTGFFNASLGTGSLFANTTGYKNTATGGRSLQNNTLGEENTGTGESSLYTNITGNQNTALGASTLHNLSSGNANTAGGYATFYSSVSTTQNTGFGYEVGFNSTGDFNTAGGWRSLYANVGGTNNTAWGLISLGANTSGQKNTAIGENSLGGNLTHNNSVAVGYYALANSDAAEDVAVGAQALQLVTSGGDNTAIGHKAGVSVTSGNAVTTGSSNTFLGAYAGPGSSTQRTFLTVIGSEATGDCASCIVLGRSTDTVFMPGSAALGAAFSGTLFNISTAQGGTNANILRLVSVLTPTASSGYGLIVTPQFGSSVENIQDAVNIYIGATKGNSGAIVNNYGIQVATNSMTTTNSYGIFITAPSGGGTTNEALHTSGKNVMASLNAASGTPSSLCEVTATGEVTVNAALTCTVSSRDYKTKIEPFAGDRDLFMAIHPVQFAYKDATSRMRWGFIAEELQAVDSKLADGYDKSGVARSIDQNALLALTVAEVQKLRLEVESMKAAR